MLSGLLAMIGLGRFLDANFGRIGGVRFIAPSDEISPYSVIRYTRMNPTIVVIHPIA